MTLTPDNIDEVLSEDGIVDKDVSAIGVGFAKDKCFSLDFSNYFDTTDGGNTFNKYNFDGGLTVLDTSDDAATANIGSEYRMPTQADFKELINNCVATFIDLQDNEYSKSEAADGSIEEYNLKGIKFTGPNGNSIFIPISGYCYDYVLEAAYCFGNL